MPPARPKENPLTNFLVNILLPVIALSALGKEGEKMWHIGAAWGMSLAVLLPLCYGIWYFARHRAMNPFSLIGLVSVLLTGGITLMVWRADGSIHEQAALLFATKEAAIPLVLGITVIVSHFTHTPLIRVFIFNPEIFDLERIRRALVERKRENELEGTLWRATLAFGGAFLVSTVLNFALAYYFLSAVDTVAANAREAYNDAVARQTLWGFFVIGVPVFVILIGMLFWLLNRLGQLTGLSRDDLLVAR